MSRAIDIHRDTGHKNSSVNSTTVNLNLFWTEYYIPEDIGSGPWKLNKNNSITNYSGNDEVFSHKMPLIKGYLGETEAWFNLNTNTFLDSTSK